MNNELILSNYKIGQVVFYIMDCKILEKKVIGLKAEMIVQSNGILESLWYKINVTSNSGWVRPKQLFETKIEAGEHLLAMNGLDVTLKEIV